MWFKHWKTILLLAIPSIASFASMTVTGTINLIMVGHIGSLVIAIVGVSNIIMYNAFAIFSGIGHTINYLVAQSYGAKNMKNGIERTYIALYLCLIVSIIISAVGFFASDFILKLIANNDQLAKAGSGYLELRFYALSFGIFNFVFHGFFRGIGDTKTPMILSIVSNVVMIFFTYTLTYGQWGFPSMGLTGAGAAILIGEALGFVGCMYVYFVTLHRPYRTRSKVKFNLAESKLIGMESGKLGLQEFSLSISMFLFTIFVSHLGTKALAANEIALSIMSFGFMPAFAFGATATILVGQQVGKGKPEEAKRIGTETAIMGSFFLLLLGVLEFVFAGPLARIYTNEVDVSQLVSFLIMISAFLQIFDGLLNMYAGGLRGIGDTTFLLVSSLLLGFVLFVPLTYLFTFVFAWGSIGAWLSLYAFIFAFGIMVMIRFYKTDWASIQTKQATEKA